MRLAVGIPTRNRAELAMASIESVTRAGAPEITVVVSDNSTDAAEAERLEAFCATHPAAPTYIRPPASLPMADHWEWLWNQLRERVGPTHVTYLTDRSVFAWGAPARLLEVVRRHPDQVVSYHWDFVKDFRQPVELEQRPWTGALFELDTRALLAIAARGLPGDHVPRLMNCVAPVETIEAIERRFGNVFISVSPDYRFAYRCLALRDTILYLDRACLIDHGTIRSAGGSFLRGTLNADATRFAQELTVERFGSTPVPAFETVANAVFEEYCSVREETGGTHLPAPGRRSYLAAQAVAADRIEDPQWRARTEDLLRRHGYTHADLLRTFLETALAMAGYFIRHPSAMARTMKRQLWDRPPGSAAAYVLLKLGIDPRIKNDLRFASDAEAMAYAESHPRPPGPYAWHVHQLERSGAVVRRTELD